MKTTKFSFLIYEQLKNEEDQVTSRSTRNLFKHCTSPACRLNSFVIERQLKNIASQCTFSTKTQHKREEITSWLPLYMRPSQHCKSNDAHLVTFAVKTPSPSLCLSTAKTKLRLVYLRLANKHKFNDFIWSTVFQI